MPAHPLIQPPDHLILTPPLRKVHLAIYEREKRLEAACRKALSLIEMMVPAQYSADEREELRAALRTGEVPYLAPAPEGLSLITVFTDYRLLPYILNRAINPSTTL
jgi:hypothetical protein